MADDRGARQKQGDKSYRRALDQSLFWTWLALVLASVAALGIMVAGYNMYTDEVRLPSVIMAGMIAPMGLMVLLLMVAVRRVTLRAMAELGDAMHRVAGGDFSVRLDPAHAEPPLARTYEDFNTMAQELGSIQELREGFVSDFSHEFKTPINSINGFANLLIEGDVDADERDEYLRIIARESERLARLATNTLTLSRLDAQAILPNRQELAVDESVRQAVASLYPQVAEAGVELGLDLAPSHVLGNASQLAEVWINLVGNALKFTPRGGRIDVTSALGPAAGTVTVCVADTGCGMTADQCTHVFDRYWQGDPSHAAKGNGLGLAIAHRIVELHGGTIAVESVPDGGTTFSVELPLAPASRDDATERS